MSVLKYIVSWVVEVFIAICVMTSVGQFAVFLGVSQIPTLMISFMAAVLVSMYIQSFRSMLRPSKQDKKSCCQDQDQSNQGENQ